MQYRLSSAPFLKYTVVLHEKSILHIWALRFSGKYVYTLSSGCIRGTQLAEPFPRHSTTLSMTSSLLWSRSPQPLSPTASQNPLLRNVSGKGYLIDDHSLLTCGDKQRRAPNIFKEATIRAMYFIFSIFSTEERLKLFRFLLKYTEILTGMRSGQERTEGGLWACSLFIATWIITC